MLCAQTRSGFERSAPRRPAAMARAQHKRGWHSMHDQRQLRASGPGSTANAREEGRSERKEMLVWLHIVRARTNRRRRSRCRAITNAPRSCAPRLPICPRSQRRLNALPFALPWLSPLGSLHPAGSESYAPSQVWTPASPRTRPEMHGMPWTMRRATERRAGGRSRIRTPLRGVHIQLAGSSRRSGRQA